MPIVSGIDDNQVIPCLFASDFLIVNLSPRLLSRILSSSSRFSGGFSSLIRGRVGFSRIGEGKFTPPVGSPSSF